MKAAGVFPPTGAGGPIAALALPPVLTGSSSLIVREGLSLAPAEPSPPPAAAAPTLVAALGAAGVLKLLGSVAAVLAGSCLALPSCAYGNTKKEP